MNLRNMNSRRWCFTVNNPDAGVALDLEDIRLISTYMVWQLEIGDNGTNHFQGYVEFLNRKKGSTLKNLFTRCDPHLEAARGTPTQASEYCKKDDTRVPGDESGPWEFGELTQVTQGSRTDLISVKAKIDDGTDLLSISDEHPNEFMKYTRGIEKMYSMHVKPRTTKTIFIIFWGITDQGKSHLANLFPNPLTVAKATSTQFYDGYDPNYHKTIIFDDFKGKLEFGELLKLTDKWPYQVNRKGDTMVWKPQYLVITSNYSPDIWYKKKCNDIKSWPAFQRRIDLEVEFTGMNKLHIIKEKPIVQDFPEAFIECFDNYEFVEKELNIELPEDLNQVVGNYDQQLHLGTIFN